MWPDQIRDTVEAVVPTCTSARGRLTAGVLEIAQERRSRAALSLQQMRDVLDEVLTQDLRFPFHLAAWLQERMGQKRLAVALLVEAANRIQCSRRQAGRTGNLPFSLRPLVARVVEDAPDAAYAMAYQVHHFGWGMPSALRLALSEVLDGVQRRGHGAEDVEPALAPPTPRPMLPRRAALTWKRLEVACG